MLKGDKEMVVQAGKLEKGLKHDRHDLSPIDQHVRARRLFRNSGYHLLAVVEGSEAEDMAIAMVGDTRVIRTATDPEALDMSLMPGVATAMVLQDGEGEMKQFGTQETRNIDVAIGPDTTKIAGLAHSTERGIAHLAIVVSQGRQFHVPSEGEVGKELVPATQSDPYALEHLPSLARELGLSKAVTDTEVPQPSVHGSYMAGAPGLN